MPIEPIRQADRISRRITMARGRSGDVSIPAKGSLVTTSETHVEGVHFDLAYTSPWEIGFKALSVALSDFASMGALPAFANVSIGIRQDTSEAFVSEIQNGFQSLAKRFGVESGAKSLFHSPQSLMVTVHLVGTLQRKPYNIFGAKPGHVIFVTGVLGSAAAGNQILRRLGRNALDRYEDIRNSFLLPEPRLFESEHLHRYGASSVIDLSEGLSSDLSFLCEHSSVGARIYEEKIPVSKNLHSAAELVHSSTSRWAMFGPEDFQLLFTVPKANAAKLVKAFQKLRRSITEIGCIAPRSQGVSVTKRDGETVPFGAQQWHPLVRRRRGAF